MLENRFMQILINATNLKAGGGLQVADSICCTLKNFPQHHFIVVLSSFLENTTRKIENFENVTVYTYTIQNELKTLIFQTNRFLDNLIKEKDIDIVLTIFGPSRWKPTCPHLCGFASAQLVLRDSPYYTQGLSLQNRIKETLRRWILTFYYKRCSTFFYTENPMISRLVEKLFKRSIVYTVTNYYNQVFNKTSDWIQYCLPTFKGITLLTISSAYLHKNLRIAIGVAKILKQEHPDFNFRFVFTITEEEYPEIPVDLREHFLFIGRVDIAECPSLYQQADIMFQPTLLECFTATYPEAMKMEVPIVTTDLEFSRGLCGEAAMYYDPLSAQDAAEAIYKVATNKALRTKLTDAGKQQLLTYDTYDQRAEKLIGILEKIVQQRTKG